MSQKSPNCQGLAQCNWSYMVRSWLGPGNNMVSELNHHSVFHVSKNIYLHLASFYATKYFWKNNMGKCSLNKLLNWNWRALGPLAIGIARAQEVRGSRPSRSVINDKNVAKKSIVSSVSVSYSIFRVQRFLLAFVNNIDDQGPQAPSIHILPTNLNAQIGRNWEFFPKICYLRSSSILFMVVMQ